MNFDEFYLRADTFKKEVDCLKVLKESFISEPESLWEKLSKLSKESLIKLTKDFSNPKIRKIALALVGLGVFGTGILNLKKESEKPIPDLPQEIQQKVERIEQDIKQAEIDNSFQKKQEEVKIAKTIKEPNLDIFKDYENYLNRVIYYETGGTGNPRKKYWDVDAWRNGYGTFWKEGDGDVPLPKFVAMERLIAELKENKRLVEHFLKPYPQFQNLSLKQKLPLIDLAFNAGIKSVKDCLETTGKGGYDRLIKNTISASYSKEGKVKKLQRGLLKRRIDMANPLFASLSPEDQDKAIDDKYAKLDKVKPLK